MVFQKKTKIIKNTKVAPRHYKMSLSFARIAQAAKPGQFLQIKVSNGDEPLLRRPFSIHQIRGTVIEVLYEVLGPGTKILSQKKSGGYLDILGPLGNGFSYPLVFSDDHLPLLVAGGMGVAPIFFLAAQIMRDYSKFNLPVLVGGKTKNQIVGEKEFKKLGCRVKISTDDGSRGFKGKVTDLLKSILRPTNKPYLPVGRKRQTTIYACGPRPMLKEISKISQHYKIPAQISLEEHMACGIGACLGCAVKTKDGFQRTCKEGPVFNADEIIWQ